MCSWAQGNRRWGCSGPSGPSKMSLGGGGCTPTLSPWSALICKTALAVQQPCSPRQLKTSLHDSLSTAADILGTCPVLPGQGQALCSVGWKGSPQAYPQAGAKMHLAAKWEIAGGLQFKLSLSSWVSLNVWCLGWRCPRWDFLWHLSSFMPRSMQVFAPGGTG